MEYPYAIQNHPQRGVKKVFHFFQTPISRHATGSLISDRHVLTLNMTKIFHIRKQNLSVFSTYIRCNHSISCGNQNERKVHIQQKAFHYQESFSHYVLFENLTEVNYLYVDINQRFSHSSLIKTLLTTFGSRQRFLLHIA